VNPETESTTVASKGCVQEEGMDERKLVKEYKLAVLR
jgi:hypothetical protein